MKDVAFTRRRELRLNGSGGQAAHDSGQIQQGRPLTGGDVENPTARLRMLTGQQVGADHITDVYKVARLLAVTIDERGLSRFQSVLSLSDDGAAGRSQKQTVNATERGRRSQQPPLTYVHGSQRLSRPSRLHRDG